MREFAETIIFLLTLIGLCFIIGLATRNTQQEDKDKDDAIMTLVRGLGGLIAVSTGLGIVAAIIYLILLPFI